MPDIYKILEFLRDRILELKLDHPVRVGIDGVDASGKTTFAEKLADYLSKTQKREVIRASIDGFHNPRSIRYNQGRNSPEGYYEDSFDNQAVIDNLLGPLGKQGKLKYRTAMFDFKTDSKVDLLPKTASQDSILIMEGVFLFRPELEQYWDLKVFIDADFKHTVPRATKRDGHYLGTEQEIIDKYNQRYVPGQKIYFEKADPKEKADIVIDNNDFENPMIIKG